MSARVGRTGGLRKGPPSYRVGGDGASGVAQIDRTADARVRLASFPQPPCGTAERRCAAPSGDRPRPAGADTDTRAEPARYGRAGLDREAATAAAGALHVRVVELEPRAVEPFDVVDLGAVEVLVAQRVDVELDAVRLRTSRPCRSACPRSRGRTGSRRILRRPRAAEALARRRPSASAISLTLPAAFSVIVIIGMVLFRKSRQYKRFPPVAPALTACSRGPLEGPAKLGMLCYSARPSARLRRVTRRGLRPACVVLLGAAFGPPAASKVMVVSA